jgi:hypothetical protein
MLGGVAQFCKAKQDTIYFYIGPDAAYLCAAISMEESGEERTVVFA